MPYYFLVSRDQVMRSMLYHKDTRKSKKGVQLQSLKVLFISSEKKKIVKREIVLKCAFYPYMRFQLCHIIKFHLSYLNLLLNVIKYRTTIFALSDSSKRKKQVDIRKVSKLKCNKNVYTT